MLMNRQYFFLGNFLVLVFLLVFFYFFTFDTIYCNDILDSYYNPRMYYIKSINYDRNNYYNLYSMNFVYLKSYALDVNKFYYSLIYNYMFTDFSYKFYVFKYIYFMEDDIFSSHLKNNLKMDLFTYVNSIYSSKGAYSYLDYYINIYTLGKYKEFSNLSLNKEAIFDKHSYSLTIYSLSSYIQYFKAFIGFKKSSFFNSLYYENFLGVNFFILNLEREIFPYIGYFFYFIFSLLYIFSIYILIFFFIFIFFFHFLFNFYLSYKFFFVGKILKILILLEDEGDDYVGRAKGYVHFLADEDDLSFNEMYYNILKYEFNYLNYLVYNNYYLFSWLFFDYKSINNFFLGLGQIRIEKFNFFSLLFSKVETSFYSFLIYEDGDPSEWRFFPYEHLTIAFPESDFYLKDALFQYGQTDLAYDFDFKKNYKFSLILHPYSISYFYGSEDEYDENLTDISGFLKEYRNSDKILSTYVKRFKGLYKRYKFNVTHLEKEVNYMKPYDYYLEMISRYYDIDLEMIYENSFDKGVNTFRLEYDRQNTKYLDSLFKLDEDSDNRNIMEEYLVGDLEENDFGYSYEKLNKVKDLIYEKKTVKYLEKNYIKNYSSYIKFRKLLISKNFSFRNFLMYFGFDPFIQFFLRSKGIWSMLSSSEEDSLELDRVETYGTNYIFDKNISSKFSRIYENFNFSQALYFNSDNLSYSIGMFIYTGVSKGLYETTSFLPPYKSFLGFFMMNPYLRINRDLFLFNSLNVIDFNKLIKWLFFSCKIKNINYANYLSLKVFELSVNKTYYLTNNSYPLGLTVSSNKNELDVYNNSFLDSLRSYELENDEDLDFVTVKEERNDIIKSFLYFFFIPLVGVSIYGYTLFINLF